jgi:hypothetical protein
MPNDLPNIRVLADYMFNRGVGIAFVAVTVVLLFVYFVRLIFKRPPAEKLEDIYVLVLEIKLKLEQLLGKEKEK